MRIRGWCASGDDAHPGWCASSSVASSSVASSSVASSSTCPLWSLCWLDSSKSWRGQHRHVIKWCDKCHTMSCICPLPLPPFYDIEYANCRHVHSRWVQLMRRTSLVWELKSPSNSLSTDYTKESGRNLLCRDFHPASNSLATCHVLIFKTW